MKRSEKQLPSKVNFSTFLQLNCKRVTKIVKEIRFEGIWGELESNKSLQRQSGIVHYGKSLISVFQTFLAGINKIFILAGRLVTRVSLYGV